MIRNPVLTGFHPDPSILYKDGLFYIANSTFEYFPGVCVSVSPDLANWEKAVYPLSEKRLLDMRGNPPGGGVWAPCLTYCDGLFYLAYSDVKYWAHDAFKDTPNYITTAPCIDGPWSDPVYINCSGFDCSVFHDTDGRKYFLNMEWDYRKAGDAQFSGILLTEIDPVTLLPVKEPVNIFTGTDRGSVEGAHIYNIDGYYYLLAAEGGTVYMHAETVARSKDIYGPYEVHPEKHLVDASGAPDSPLQKTGHGSLCQGPDGRWWFAFLTGRPLEDTKNCPLGRETGIAEVVWRDGWPYLKDGGCVPPEYFEGYGVTNTPAPAVINYDFTGKAFNLDFMSLRTPARFDIEDGALRLYGGDSPISRFDQNFLARRQSDFSFEFDTAVSFKFNHFGRMAGLIYRYNEENQYFLRVAYDERRGQKTLGVLCFDKERFSMPLADDEIPVGNLVHLRLRMDGRYGCFSYSLDGETYCEIPYRLDSAILSDEYATPLGFTGAFVGMSCVDLVDKHSFADFLYARYRPFGRDE